MLDYGMERGAPGAPAADVLREVSLAAAVASWCEALRDGADLRAGLGAVATAFGARYAALSRISTEKRSVRAVIWDAEGGAGGGRSFADGVLGPYALKARLGAVWSAAHFRGTPGSEALDLFHAARGLREMLVVPIATGPRSADLLELHFPELRDSPFPAVSMLADVIAGSWARRAPGRFLEEVLRGGRAERPWHGEEDLLGAANPAGLSRAEYRICLMLARGLTGSALARELCIQPSTLKSHLRSVFAKTGSSGQAELVFRLLSRRGTAQAEAAGGARAARPGA